MMQVSLAVVQPNLGSRFGCKHTEQTLKRQSILIETESQFTLI